jgi:ABC-type glycerol-3-phosphate transport system substrate-binding protein
VHEQRVPATVASECTYQGKQYCYPIGTNSIGLFYNKAMLKAVGLQPPTTWAELESDAKKLTKAPVYGVAFDATGDEQSTWQLEPFFWSDGASLTKVDTPPFASAPQLWVNMVKDGSASKSSPSSTPRAGPTTTSTASFPSPPTRPARPWSRRSAGRPSTWAPAAPPSSRSSPGNGCRACSSRR